MTFLLTRQQAESGKPNVTIHRRYDLLVGLVVKASASRKEDSRFESRLHRDFFGVESYQ